MDKIEVGFMTAKEILETKEVLRVEDFMLMLNISKTVAYKVMRGIKSYKDTLELSGRILKQDYIDWKNRKRKAFGGINEDAQAKSQ